MLTLKCAIVDDENFAIELLSDHIKLFQELNVVKSFTDPAEALVKITPEDRIDILFLDIDMPGLSGLELGMRLKSRVKYIIFTTAFSKYALEAFGVRAQDYLLKPIEKIKFIESIQEILELEKRRLPVSKDLLFVKSNLKGKFVGIKISQVILIYIEGHRLFIVEKNQKYETTESLKNIEQRLSDNLNFLRIHNSNIVNLEKIIKIEGNTIELEGKYKVPISEKYKPKLINAIGVESRNNFQ